MGRLATGVVLAGGQSRRMGESKAALMIGGEPLLRRVVQRLLCALPAVIVVGPSALANLLVGVPVARVVPDLQSGMGPLGGLETALTTAATPYIFAVACDMPFVAPDLVRALVALASESPGSDAVVLRTAHGVEQLHAVYARSCLPVISAQLTAHDLALHHLLARLRVREMPVEEAARYDPRGLSAFNANRPDEWTRALALAKQEAT